MRDDNFGNTITVIRPLEVKINGSYEDGMRRFKSEFQKEKILTELKIRSSYEKPSEKKRRKRRESRERALQAEMRERMINSGEWDKRIQQKLRKKAEKEKRKADTKL